jgi:alkyl hydroperoxide reductase subunit AhpC
VAVAEKYGVLLEEGMAERAVFIIDKKGAVREELAKLE